MAKAVKKVAKKAAAKQQPKVVRSAATVQAKINANPETALYEVLEPFKFQGAPVKPPSFLEMTAAEAQQYQEAGVLGTEPGEVPTSDETHGDDDAQAAAGGANPAGGDAASADAK